MRTVGIVGGCDFLGCDITLKFLYENYFVKVLDLPRSKHTPQLISTNISAGENLKIFSFDLNNPTQLAIFLKGCDFIIHCGRPVRLDVKTEEGSLYVPVITDSGCLLKVLSKTPAIRKIIFLTSAAALQSCNQHTDPESGNKTNITSKLHSRQRASFHSEKIILKTLDDLSVNRLEVVHVSPVLVNKNMLINTRETTLAGLQFMFRNKINHDTVFQKVANRNLVDAMFNANELPNRIFSCVNDFKENAEVQFSL